MAASPSEPDLASRIESLLRSDPAYAALTKKILRAQSRLRRSVSVEGWQRYLDIEQLTNERAELALRVVARGVR